MVCLDITRYLPEKEDSQTFPEPNGLAKELIPIFRGFVDDPDTFADYLVHLVITTDSCKGFTWIGKGQSMPLASKLLDSVIRYEIFTHPENRLELERGFETIAPSFTKTSRSIPSTPLDASSTRA